MRVFNLEAAKRGEPIMFRTSRTADDWKFARFVGMVSDGYVVIEHTKNHISQHSPNDICMAPRKRTVWVTLFVDGTADWMIDDIAVSRGSLKIIASGVPVEIVE